MIYANPNQVPVNGLSPMVTAAKNIAIPISQQGPNLTYGIAPTAGSPNPPQPVGQGPNLTYGIAPQQQPQMPQQPDTWFTQPGPSQGPVLYTQPQQPVDQGPNLTYGVAPGQNESTYNYQDQSMQLAALALLSQSGGYPEDNEMQMQQNFNSGGTLGSYIAPADMYTMYSRRNVDPRWLQQGNQGM